MHIKLSLYDNGCWKIRKFITNSGLVTFGLTVARRLGQIIPLQARFQYEMAAKGAYQFWLQP